MLDQGQAGRDWLLRLAGFGTAGLVWFVMNPSASEIAGIPASWLLHGAVAVFVACMLLSDHVRAGAPWLALVLLQAAAALGAMVAAPGSAAPILVIVLVAQLAFTPPLRRVLLMVAAVNVGVALVMIEAWGLLPLEAVLSTLLYGCFQLFALLIAAYAQAADVARQSLKEVNAELLATRSLLVESARDRERLRLSRELHDMAGHALTALKFNLRRLRQGSEGEARELADESLALAESLLEDIRALVGNLRRTDGVAVDGAIRQLTAPFDAPAFAIDLDEDATVPDVETARILISVAREGITNVVRHADAQRCRIRLGGDGQGNFELVIEDDGRGTDGKDLGHGLQGMRERLQAAGGSLEIGRSTAGGTRLAARLHAGPGEPARREVLPA